MPSKERDLERAASLMTGFAARVKWILRGRLALLAILAFGVAGALASAYLSLDRGRAHTARTAALPRLGGQADGLVQIPANGMTFRARVAGLRNPGPAVMLLHGFPQTSALWEPLIGAAAAQGCSRSGPPRSRRPCSSTSRERAEGPRRQTRREPPRRA